MPRIIRKYPPHPRCGRCYRGLRIGLLGGSFNPAHDGHLRLARTALRRLKLDQVWWLVSPQNPLKGNADMAPLAERMTSAQALTAAHPKMLVTNLEQQMGTQYTAETITALQRHFPATRFVFLLGADNLAQLPRWQDWEGIFARMPLAVFPRKPYAVSALTGKAARRFAATRRGSRNLHSLTTGQAPAWGLVPMRLCPLSATQIRQGRGGHFTLQEDQNHS